MPNNSFGRQTPGTINKRAVTGSAGLIRIRVRGDPEGSNTQFIGNCSTIVKSTVQSVSVAGLREGDLEEHVRQKVAPVRLRSLIPLGLRINTSSAANLTPLHTARLHSLAERTDVPSTC